MKKTTKDKKLYGNCLAYSANNYLIFRCDEKKANWYIDRNLAVKINDNPFTFKFNFTPKGNGYHGKEYGLCEMKNVCVKCGNSEFLTRHHVVPVCYRKFLPLNLKSHNFHDVVGMCYDCHSEYEVEALKLKTKLAIQYNAPIQGIVTSGEYPSKIIKECYTIFTKRDFIPQKRIEEILYSITEYLGRKPNLKDIEIISKSQKIISLKTHGEIVISQIADYQKFIEMWRQHFIEKTGSKFMPDGWAISNKIIINI